MPDILSQKQIDALLATTDSWKTVQAKPTKVPREFFCSLCGSTEYEFSGCLLKDDKDDESRILWKCSGCTICFTDPVKYTVWINCSGGKTTRGNLTRLVKGRERKIRELKRERDKVLRQIEKEISKSLRDAASPEEGMLKLMQKAMREHKSSARGGRKK